VAHPGRRIPTSIVFRGGEIYVARPPVSCLTLSRSFGCGLVRSNYPPTTRNARDRQVARPARVGCRNSFAAPSPPPPPWFRSRSGVCVSVFERYETALPSGGRNSRPAKGLRRSRREIAISLGDARARNETKTGPPRALVRGVIQLANTFGPAGRVLRGRPRRRPGRQVPHQFRRAESVAPLAPSSLTTSRPRYVVRDAVPPVADRDRVGAAAGRLGRPGSGCWPGTSRRSSPTCAGKRRVKVLSPVACAPGW
jgi:hypothetical protein